MEYLPSAHAPRSIKRQRSQQKGRYGFLSEYSHSRPQVGHFTLIAIFTTYCINRGGKASPREFPGGKVEAGETLEEALVREMKEELGVQVTDCREVYSTVFTYPHATVHLHFLHCRLNPEELKCLEGQTYRFCTLEDLPHPILPATEPVLAQVTARK